MKAKIKTNDVVYDPELCHEFCRRNRESIKKSKKVGCFHCIGIFDAKMVVNYDGDNAHCPACSYDTLIQDVDIPVNETFLVQMNSYWFCNSHVRPK
jgi:hypothetical protein